MAKWEIEITPDEVEEVMTEYIKTKYGIDKWEEIEAINEWPYVTIKMGRYTNE